MVSSDDNSTQGPNKPSSFAGDSVLAVGFASLSIVVCQSFF